MLSEPSGAPQREPAAAALCGPRAKLPKPNGAPQQATCGPRCARGGRPARKGFKHGGRRPRPLAVSELVLGSVILPRSESPKAASRLAEFEWFHKVDADNETVTPEIDDVLLRAQKVHQSLDEVVRGLGIPPRVGILEILFKGTVFKKRSYELDEIGDMVADLEAKAPDAVARASALLERDAAARRRLEENESLRDALQAASRLDIDVGRLSGAAGPGRRFFTELFVIDSAAVPEAERALAGSAALYRYDLESKSRSALFVAAASADADRILKVMRGLNAAPLAIPPSFSQVPSEAHAAAAAGAKDAAGEIKRTAKELAAVKKEVRGGVLALHEAAAVAKDVLETLRKPGGTRRFAVIQGYIPKKMEGKFKKVTGQWTSVTEEITDPDELARLPVHLDNPRWVRTYEVITDSQGTPKRGEFDPTWMISLMWPIFYGIMFADLGHGLALMALGLLFKFKGQGRMARWGMLLAMSGAAAAIAGVFQGEVFGFHLEYFAPFGALLHEGGPLHSISWLVGAITVAELTFEQVILILKVSIFIGVIHLAWAFLLRIHRYRRTGNRDGVIFEGIPNLFMWLGVFGVMMGAIGSGYDVMNMYSRAHAEPVPWVTVILGEWAVTWIVVRVSIVVVIASMVLMIIGGIKHNKRHPEEGGDAVSVVMEVLLGKTIECLAHTISYARIGIMLLVHAALLLTVNSAFKSMGGLDSPGAVVLIVGGQIGIMMIEGLIVYIQSLRLHLYEFFTKWYDGGSRPFRQLVPETVYNTFEWKAKREAAAPAP